MQFIKNNYLFSVKFVTSGISMSVTSIATNLKWNGFLKTDTNLNANIIKILLQDNNTEYFYPELKNIEQEKLIIKFKYGNIDYHLVCDYDNKDNLQLADLEAKIKLNGNNIVGTQNYVTFCGVVIMIVMAVLFVITMFCFSALRSDLSKNHAQLINNQVQLENMSKIIGNHPVLNDVVYIKTVVNIIMNYFVIELVIFVGVLFIWFVKSPRFP
jgi:hypothetical protein